MPFVKRLNEIGERLRNVLATKGETVEHTESQLTQANESVNAARQAVELAELTLEQSFGNPEADVHVAWNAVKNAKDGLNLAEAQREAILKQLERAEADKQQTAHELRKEELLADVGKLHDAAREADMAMARLVVAAEKWRKCANRIREYGNFELDTKLKSAVQLFRVRVLDGSGMSEHRTGLNLFVGSKSWLEDQLTPEDIERVTSKKRVA